MKVVLEWLRRFRWCARLDPLIFSAIMISLLSVVSGAQTSGTCECDQQCPKTRELVTTVWGGAVTILVLSFDMWSATKPFFMDAHASTSEKVGNWCLLLTGPVLNPLMVLSEIIHSAAWRYYTRRRMRGFTVLSLLSPRTKDPAKIVHGCPVVVTVPTVISFPLNFTEKGMPSLSGAVVIGRGPAEEARETKPILLGGNGKAVLLQMKNVLPPYDELRALQGSSGLATIISAVQSVGYIYGVVVRTVQGLPVSPIEVVALTLSIQILIKALLHNIASTCHRPLHLHLTQDQAQTLADECKIYTAHADPKSWVVGPLVVMVLLVSGVAIYYIIHMWHTTRRIMVVPIILTVVGLYLQLIGGLSYYVTEMERKGVDVDVWSTSMSALVNATSYIFALVVTIKYWKADRLDAKTSSMLAYFHTLVNKNISIMICTCCVLLLEYFSIPFVLG
jgi:hypothetical protein